MTASRSSATRIEEWVDEAAEKSSRQERRSDKSNSVLRHGRSLVECAESGPRLGRCGVSVGRFGLWWNCFGAAAAHANVSAFARSVGSQQAPMARPHSPSSSLTAL